MRKFYRLELRGNSVELHWGRIGTQGQRKTLSFATSAEAEAELERQRLRRLQHGYTLVRDESAAHDRQAALAKDEGARLAAVAPLGAHPRFVFRHAKKRRYTWIEQHDGEVWSASGALDADLAPASAGAQVDKEDLGGVAAAKRAIDTRVAKLLAEGYVLDAFGAAPAKKARGPAAPKEKSPEPPAAPQKPWPPSDEVASRERLRGYTLAFFGEFASWPRYHDGTPAQVAERRGATVASKVDASVDVVVLGDRRGPGRAEGKKAAEGLRARGRLRILDEAAYRDLVRMDLRGARFAFAGGFDCSPSGLEDGVLARMVQTAGGVVTEDVDEQLDFLVLGNRRGPGKITRLREAERLAAAGARVHVVDESAFLELVRIEQPAHGGALDFASFLNHMYATVDEAKVGRALAMLREDRHQLFSSLDDDRLVGVVRSQSGSDTVYASFLKPSGDYGCARSDLHTCMGLQGSPCKHLLVLVLGLTRAGGVPAETTLAWMRAARGKRPRTDDALCTETFVRYGGAQAGEIDWRPTETLPEDFYAV